MSDVAVGEPGWHLACLGTHPVLLGGPAGGERAREGGREGGRYRGSCRDAVAGYLCGGIVYRATRGGVGRPTRGDKVTGCLLWYCLQRGGLPRDL